MPVSLFTLRDTSGDLSDLATGLSEVEASSNQELRWLP